MSKICHKHLATKTHNNKRQKSARPGWLQNCQKKTAKPKKKVKSWQKNWRTEKMRKYQKKKNWQTTKTKKTGNGKSAKKN